MICKHDLEGVVAKWRFGAYQAAGRTSWLKIKNPNTHTGKLDTNCSRSAGKRKDGSAERGREFVLD